MAGPPVGREPYPPDIGEVGAPLQVSGDGLETDKEAGEQEDRDGSHWTHKGGHLRRGEWSLAVKGVTTVPSTPWQLLMSPVRPPHLGANFPTCKEVEAAPIKSPKD